MNQLVHNPESELDSQPQERHRGRFADIQTARVSRAQVMFFVSAQASREGPAHPLNGYGGGMAPETISNLMRLALGENRETVLADVAANMAQAGVSGAETLSDFMNGRRDVQNPSQLAEISQAAGQLIQNMSDPRTLKRLAGFPQNSADGPQAPRF